MFKVKSIYSEVIYLVYAVEYLNDDLSFLIFDNIDGWSWISSASVIPKD